VKTLCAQALVALDDGDSDGESSWGDFVDGNL
jgi:hypothetical protein